MKRVVRQLFLCGMLVIILSSVSAAQIEKTYTGAWKFEAPEAPEGSTEGNIEIKINEVVMTFDDIVLFPSNWVKARNDSIIYETSFDLAIVVFSLRIIDKDHLTGKAVWKDGQTPVFLTKKIVGVKI